MRVISQNEAFDMSYDAIAIEVKAVKAGSGEHDRIIISDIHTDKRLASYTTNIKAKKAMRALHAAYSEYDKTFQFPDDDEFTND